MSLKFKGALNTYMEPRVIGLLMSETDAEIKRGEWAAQDLKNLNLLCEHFGIAKGPHQFMALSLRLAQEIVPCFQVKPKEGRPKKWTSYALCSLGVEVWRLTEEGRTVASACSELSRREPWKSILEAWNSDSSSYGPDPAEAIESAYKRAIKDKSLPLAKEAFLYHKMTNTVSEWDADLMSLKGNN